MTSDGESNMSPSPYGESPLAFSPSSSTRHGGSRRSQSSQDEDDDEFAEEDDEEAMDYEMDEDSYYGDDGEHGEMFTMEDEEVSINCLLESHFSTHIFNLFFFLPSSWDLLTSNWNAIIFIYYSIYFFTQHSLINQAFSEAAEWSHVEGLKF